MNQDELLNTPSFKYKEHVIPLTKVLDNIYNINFFSFCRIHKDYGRLTVGNSLNFALRYWNEYVDVDITYKPDRLKNFDLLIYNGEKTAKTEKEKELCYVRQHEFDLSDQGIMIIRRFKNYRDTFNFSSIKYQNDRISPLLAILDELNLYCDFFLKEINHILKDLSNYTKINVPFEDKLFTKQTSNQNRYIRNIDDPLTSKFYTKYLYDKYETHLTNSELECLKWAYHGKTAEETSIILNKSARTIESHLSSVKSKFNVNKLSVAIQKAEKFGIIKGYHD